MAPKWLTNRFWTRLQQGLADRGLTTQPPGPASATPATPATPASRATPAQNVVTQDAASLVSPGFLERLKQKIRQIFGPKKSESPIGIAQPKGGVGLDRNAKLALVREAAAKRVRLAIIYNGTPRHVGPISYRWRAKNPSDNPLIYCHCWLHSGKVEAFIPNRIEGIWLTQESYSSPWPIEIT